MQNLIRATVPCILQPFVLLAEEAYSFFNSNAPIFLQNYLYAGANHQTGSPSL